LAAAGSKKAQAKNDNFQKTPKGNKDVQYLLLLSGTQHQDV
jgi:hypothetical protein